MYFSPGGKVAIIGSIDNNYVTWFSVSDYSDIEGNSEVFDLLFQKSLRQVASRYTVFYWNGDYPKVDNWYSKKINLDFNGLIYQALDEEKPYYWKPLVAQEVAKEVKKYFLLMRKRADLRAEHYQPILKSWLNKLYVAQEESGAFAYQRLENVLIPLINKENYLLLANDDTIRQSYIQVKKLLKSLYNDYQTAIR
ncbi:hypothetical protein [Lactococcus cremoris]|uniref:hypothetical protein n=1 Tax=Lactococcus lactis subsp. cremoris TaxID=1359 RepID=UPI0007AEB8C8|nr:hypothetical protein [Lactococcus cremoris]